MTHIEKKKENTPFQNFWDAVKAFLREKFIMIQVYIRKQTLKLSDIHIKELEKEEKTNPEVSRRKKPQKTLNFQSNLEKIITFQDFIILQIYSNQSSIVLAQKQTHRSLKKN